jgi:hypothetical protein
MLIQKLIALGLFMCMAATPVMAEEEAEVKLETGQPAPVFSLPDQKGVTRNLADYGWCCIFIPKMTHRDVRPKPASSGMIILN